ncbi:MAG: translation initiation factor IF-3 [Catenulispora sp.]
MSTNFRHNEQIRISPIFLIDADEQKIGQVSTAEALRKAREAGLDLVEVAPNARPPVCRIMDYGKWRYQQQKKEDKSRASNKGGQLKELKLKTVKIGDHDLMIKVNHAKDFLKEGNKVQFTLQFRGREMAHLELGREIFKKIKDELWPVSKVERDAKMEGRRMTLVLQPDHKAPGAVRPTVGGTAPKGAMTAGSGMNIPPRTGMGPGVRPPMGGPARPGVGAPAAAPARPAAAAPVAPPRPAPAPTTQPAAAPQPATAGAGAAPGGR